MSHGDLVEALFSSGGPPPTPKRGKNVNTIKIQHVPLLTSIPDKEKLPLQHKLWSAVNVFL